MTDPDPTFPLVRAISQHPRLARHLDALDIQFDAGRVVLTGRLPSFHLKQLLQETVRRSLGDAGSTTASSSMSEQC